MVRKARGECVDQRFGRARLAERNCMNPNQRKLAVAHVASKTEALGPMQPILGLSPRAPEQIKRGERHREESNRCVCRAYGGHELRLITRAIASITSPAAGAAVALPTLITALPASASPVSPTNAGS